MINFCSLCFLVDQQPFEKPLLNYLSMFNETMGLLISYLLLPLQDLKFEPSTHDIMGRLIWYTLLLSGFFNGLTVGLVSLVDLRGKAKLLFNRHCGKKHPRKAKLHLKPS